VYFQPASSHTTLQLFLDDLEGADVVSSRAGGDNSYAIELVLLGGLNRAGTLVVSLFARYCVACGYSLVAMFTVL